MTPYAAKRRVLDILKMSAGDNLERAQAVFINYTPEQMQEQYGESGSTCQQVLDAYIKERQEDEDAFSWVYEQEVLK